MKKYLLGLSALALAIGFSSFTFIKANETKKFATTYWSYPTGDAQTQAGYSTETNYSQTTLAAFNACNGGTVTECAIAVSATTLVGGVTVPDLAALTFDINNFPNGGTFFVGNKTKR